MLGEDSNSRFEDGPTAARTYSSVPRTGAPSSDFPMSCAMLAPAVLAARVVWQQIRPRLGLGGLAQHERSEPTLPKVDRAYQQLSRQFILHLERPPGAVCR